MINKFLTLYNICLDEVKSVNLKSNKSFRKNFLNEFIKKQNSGCNFNYQEFFNQYNKKLERSNWQKVDSDIHSLEYKNKFFSDGKILIYAPTKPKKLVILLNGSLNSGDDVIFHRNSKYFLKDILEVHNCALATWTWPLQAERKNGFFPSLSTFTSVERQYAKLLNIVGSDLWEQYIIELSMCMREIEKFNKNNWGNVEIIIAGWSMGGSLGWFAPYFLNSPVKALILGSCARFQDLISFGRQNSQGLYYFPKFGPEFFDIENIAVDLLEKGNSFHVSFGEKDKNCIQNSLVEIDHYVSDKTNSDNFSTSILPNVNHSFEDVVKNALLEVI